MDCKHEACVSPSNGQQAASAFSLYDTQLLCSGDGVFLSGSPLKHTHRLRFCSITMSQRRLTLASYLQSPLFPAMQCSMRSGFVRACAQRETSPVAGDLHKPLGVTAAQAHVTQPDPNRAGRGTRLTKCGLCVRRLCARRPATGCAVCASCVWKGQGGREREEGGVYHQNAVWRAALEARTAVARLLSLTGRRGTIFSPTSA